LPTPEFSGGSPQYQLRMNVAFGEAIGVAVESKPIGGVDAGR
jgi:hypothetical protein